MTTTTQLRPVELESVPVPTPIAMTSHSSLREAQTSNSDFNMMGPAESHFSTTAIPDGGYGWVIVFIAAITTFWMNAMINCWGVLQVALLSSSMSHVPASTVSFIGSLNLACGVAFGLFATRATRQFGSRTTAMSGITLMGLGLIAAGSSTKSVAGMFVAIGLVAGTGQSAVYTVSNALPVQYFSGRLGLANGLVKLGGGIGGTAMAVALEALVSRVGIEWTFRIQGCMTIATGLPAAWFMRDLASPRNTPFVDLSMFRSLPFTAVFLAGAFGTFALFVPPFYLPLFAQSLGLSSGTGAALVAAFNLCNAIGRFGSGPLCDKVGPTNMFLITMLLNTISMLAIWPVSNTLAPLIVFVALNGIANGSYFTVVPTVAASIFGPGRAAVAMSMSVTGWTVGYLLGAPIAGYLLQAGGGREDRQKQNINVFRPAIFYAGGVATASSLFVLLARLSISMHVRSRI